MARTNNLTNFLNDVAIAIKAKLGDNTPIPASQFDTKIGEIETVGTYQSKTLNIVANGSQTVTPDTDYDALSSVVINVQVPVKQLQSKTYNFTENTHIVLSPEQGYDGFSSIDLTIAVPSSGGNLQTKNVTYDRNGEYTLTPDNGYDGISRANVTVQTPYNAKIFETVQQMNADTDAKLNDMAMIYGLQANPVSPNVNVDKWYLPKTITLPREVTEDISFEFGYGSGAGMPTLSSTGFTLYGQMSSDMFDCEYESEDGIHYTRTMINIRSMGGSNHSILWDDELNILYNVSTHNEHFWYRISNAQQAEDWLDVFQAIFREPQYVFNSLYRYMGTTNTSLITAAKNIVIHTNGSEDISEWTLEADYLYDEKTYQEFLNVVNAVKSAVSSSINYVILEYLPNNNYRVYVGKYIYTSSGSTNYTSPTLLSKLKLDNTDYNTYIGFSYNTSYYSNCELLVYNVDMVDSSNPVVTNVTSQYTINTYNVDTSYVLYTLPVSQNNYITSRGTYENQDRKMSFVIPTSSSIFGYDGLMLNLKIGMDLSYLPAETQFTLDNDNQLLPGKIALGSNGSHTGDGSIYNNLDTELLQLTTLGTQNDNTLCFIPDINKGKFSYYKYDNTGTIAECKSNKFEILDLISKYNDALSGDYGFRYLSLDKLTYCYVNTNAELIIVDVNSDTVINRISLLSKSYNYNGYVLFSIPHQQIFYAGTDTYLYVYDIASRTNHKTNVTMSNYRGIPNRVSITKNYTLVEYTTSSNNNSGSVYIINNSTYTNDATASSVRSLSYTAQTPNGDIYFCMYSSYKFFKFSNGTLTQLASSYTPVSGNMIDTTNYLYGGSYDYNKYLRINKTGGYSTMTTTVTSDCKLQGYFLNIDTTNNYVWCLGYIGESIYDENISYYIVKCTYSITNNALSLTEVDKYKINDKVICKYGNTIYANSDYSTRLLQVYYTYSCDDNGIIVTYPQVSSSIHLYDANMEFRRIVQSTYSNYDIIRMGSNIDKQNSYDNNTYDVRAYRMIFNDERRIADGETYDGPSYDTNLVLNSLDAGGAEQYLGGTPITDITNVCGFDVFNANGDSILYYVMKTVTARSNMTGFSMNNIRVLDNGVIQWIPYGNNTVFNTDDFLECTITCTDAYNNTETKIITIYNSEKENYPGPDDPGPDDPGPDDPGEL